MLATATISHHISWMRGPRRGYQCITVLPAYSWLIQLSSHYACWLFFFVLAHFLFVVCAPSLSAFGPTPRPILPHRAPPRRRGFPKNCLISDGVRSPPSSAPALRHTRTPPRPRQGAPDFRYRVRYLTADCFQFKAFLFKNNGFLQ